MKKILCLVLLFGFAYSSTGNSFLKQYPFGKDLMEMDTYEYGSYRFFRGQVMGVVSASKELLIHYEELEYITSEDARIGDLALRVCKMDVDQMIRVLKKWCDDNPTQTHKPLVTIIFLAFVPLPTDDCE